MANRIFEIGKIDVYVPQSDDSFTTVPFYHVLNDIYSNHSKKINQPHSGWVVSTNQTGTIVLKFSMKDNTIAGIFYKSGTHINVYALDQINFSDQNLTNKLTPNEEMAVVMRFLLYHNNIDSWIAFENVRTPRIKDLDEIVKLTSSRAFIEYIPLLDKQPENSKIKAYKIEWKYATPSLDPQRNFKHVEEISGRISAGRRGNLLNISINKDEGKVEVSTEDMSQNIKEIPLSEYGIKIVAEVKKGKVKEQIDIVKMIKRTIKQYKSSEIDDHRIVLEDLKSFLSQNVPYI